LPFAQEAALSLVDEHWPAPQQALASLPAQQFAPSFALQQAIALPSAFFFEWQQPFAPCMSPEQHELHAGAAAEFGFGLSLPGVAGVWAQAPTARIRASVNIFNFIAKSPE
jgi:hypothetical protein